MAAERGPLCDEPLFGVNVRLEVFPKSGDEEGTADAGAGEEQYGPFSGQVTSAAREAIRRAVLKAGPRLVEAMYLSVITTTSEALGGTYSVLGRRRAKVISETVREGTAVFIIHAYLPVAQSFGFADELRHSSSGASNAQLMLSHWEHLEVDPFFTPKTEEEREEFGEDGDVGPNIARQLVDATRRRKGLKVRFVSQIRRCFRSSSQLVCSRRSPNSIPPTRRSRRRSSRWRRNRGHSRVRREYAEWFRRSAWTFLPSHR